MVCFGTLWEKHQQVAGSVRVVADCRKQFGEQPQASKIYLKSHPLDHFLFRVENRFGYKKMPSLALPPIFAPNSLLFLSLSSLLLPQCSSLYLPPSSLPTLLKAPILSSSSLSPPSFSHIVCLPPSTSHVCLPSLPSNQLAYLPSERSRSNFKIFSFIKERKIS